MRFIDLSATIDPSDPGAKPYERVEVRYTVHTEGAAQIQGMLGVPPDLLRDREGWATRPASWQFFLIENRSDTW